MNDAFDVIEGDVLVDSGRIVSVGAAEAPALTPTIDAGGDYLLPGFVQTHIHLCQTLFRGYADDLRAARLAADAHLADGGGAHAAVAGAPPPRSPLPNCCWAAPPPC